MTRYSVQHSDRIFIKGYGFDKNMGKNIGKNISKTWLVNIARNTSKREIQKTAEATGDLIGNKITNSIKLQNNNYKIIELLIQMIQKFTTKSFENSYKWAQWKNT